MSDSLQSSSSPQNLVKEDPGKRKPLSGSAGLACTDDGDSSAAALSCVCVAVVASPCSCEGSDDNKNVPEVELWVCLASTLIFVAAEMLSRLSVRMVPG